MRDFEPLIYVLVFVATFLAGEGLLLLLADRRRARRAEERLRKNAAGLQAPEVDGEATLLRQDKSGGPLLQRLAALVPGRETLRLQLYRAGISTPPIRFLLLCVSISAAGLVVGTVVWPNPGAALLLGLLGLLPWVQVNRAAAKRTKLFEEQFPEALELLTRALRAGHALTFAFQLVGDEMADPIGSEFGQLAEEVKFGQEIRVALANLTYRVGVDDLAYFSTAVLVQRETGGNLAELLDNLGYVIRDRFKLFGKVRSLTAVGKATANILGLWPLLMVGGLSLVGADFVHALWETKTGRTLAGIGTVMVVIGYVLCRRAAVIRV